MPDILDASKFAPTDDEGGWQSDGVAVEASVVTASISAFWETVQGVSELNHMIYQMHQHFLLLMLKKGGQQMGKQWWSL